MVLKWITPASDRGYREAFAWLPVKAYDEYSASIAWVWLQSIRVWPTGHQYGRVTFNSFWV